MEGSGVVNGESVRLSGYMIRVWKSGQAGMLDWPRYLLRNPNHSSICERMTVQTYPRDMIIFSCDRLFNLRQ